MSFRQSVISRRTLLLVPALVAAACGSGTPGSPYSPVIKVVKQGQFVALPSAGTDFANAVNATTVVVVNNPVSGGSLHASITWTSSGNKVQAGFFTGECTAAQVQDQTCHIERYFPAADLVTGQTLDLFSANSGNYTLAIVNLGPGPESGTYEVELILPTTPSTY